MPKLQKTRRIQVSATMHPELVDRINAAVDGRSRSQWLCEAAELKLIAADAITPKVRK